MTPMDCEKFDQIIIDAVYEELDELTLAAAKRHADGCPHCQAAWSGLRATRKIGILPFVEAPAGIETRILQAARDAHRDLPWPRRIGRAVSWAGSYAMRPQTAMAALLLLMLGSSIIFVRAKPHPGGAGSRVNVTERGVPELAAEEPRASKGAVEPRAPTGGRPFAAPPSPTTAHEAPAREAPSPEVASEPRSKVLDRAEARPEVAAGRARSAAAAPAAPAAADDLASSRATEQGNSYAEKKRAESQPGSGAAGPAAAAPAPNEPKDAYGSAMDLFTAGRYAEAEKAFDAVAASGSKNAPFAALYAAKSAEAAFGCGKGALKYEMAASRYGGSTPGAEALWGAANCYKAVANYEKARVLYNKLRSVAGYRDKAEGELANLAILQQQQQGEKAPSQPAKPAAPPPPALRK